MVNCLPRDGTRPTIQFFEDVLEKLDRHLEVQVCKEMYNIRVVISVGHEKWLLGSQVALLKISLTESSDLPNNEVFFMCEAMYSLFV